MSETRSRVRSNRRTDALDERDRGQSHVVGVVLLLGLTAVALGGLTATVGSIVEDQTNHADATGVAADFDASLRPTETTGPREGTVTFTRGTLSTVSREVRVLDESRVLRSVDAGGLVYESDDSRVAYVGGAIVRGKPGQAWMVDSPAVVSGPDVLVVGTPRLGTSGGVSGSGGVTTTLATNVTHRRVSLGEGDFRVAIETATPGAFEQYVADRNATTTVRDIDGDGVPSAVVDYRGNRTGYLVVHEMRLEVGDG